MGAKKLKTELLFGGKVDGSLAKALKASESKAAQTSKRMSKSMTGSTVDMANSMKGAFKSVLGTAMKVFAVVKSIGKLKDLAKSSMAAAQDQIEVETKLETLLKNVGSITIRGPDAVAEATQRLIKVSDELEKTGVIAGDVSLAGFQQLATFQVNDDTIAKLSGGMMDLLAQQKGLNATQQDAVSIANLVGKAMMGQTGAMSKVGIIFDENQAKILKTGTEAEKAAAMADILAQNVGGVNEALAKTDGGQMKVAENLMGQMEEAFGNFLLPLKSKIMNYMLPMVIDNLGVVQKALDDWLPIAEGIVDTIFAKVGEGFDFLKSVFEEISPDLTELKSAVIEILNNLKEYAPSIGSFAGDALPSILSNIITIAAKAAELVAAFTGWSGFLPTVKAIGIGIGAIKFAKMIRGIKEAVTAFGLLKIAKMQDKAETLILNALCAKDTALKIANTAATMAGTAATAAWNTVCTVAAGVTKAFGAAMSFLTSPIGLVIIAIVAVIAIIVLMVKHWDLVKAKTTMAIQAISAKFTVLSAKVAVIVSAIKARFQEGFNAIRAVVASVIASVNAKINSIRAVFLSIAAALTNFLGKWKSVFNTMKSIVSNVIGSIRAKIQSVTSVFSSLGTKISNIFSKIGKLKDKASSVKVPGYSTGGTVSRPTLAMVGEGKYTETIIPHNDSPRSRSLLATAAKGMGVNLGGGNTYVFSPTIYAQNPENIVEKLEESYERFKAFMEQYRDEEDREVFV